MHRNPVWIAFFSLIVLVTLFFTFKATTSLFAYSKLSAKSVSEIEQVEIIERKGGHFIVWAHFSFLHQGKRVSAEGAIGKPYLNRYSAEKAVSKLSKTGVPLWYNPKNPQEAVLEKHFPYKQTLSGVLLLFISLYFFTLGRYIQLS